MTNRHLIMTKEEILEYHLEAKAVAEAAIRDGVAALDKLLEKDT